MTCNNEWQPISTMPTGRRVQLRREDCPGYDTTGIFEDGKLSLASFFVRSDMLLIRVPTHWRPLAEVKGGDA